MHRPGPCTGKYTVVHPSPRAENAGISGKLGA